MNLAAMHARFGHQEAALNVLNEAIMMAQEGIRKKMPLKNSTSSQPVLDRILPRYNYFSIFLSIDWGEAGCPSNVRAFLNFLEELSALRNHITTNAVEIIGVGRNKNPPALGKKHTHSLYNVVPPELKISPIMYFAIYNSVVLSKILKIVVPLKQNFEKTDFYSLKLVILIIINIDKQESKWHNDFQYF